MKNWMIFPFCALLLLSGCGSYTGMGAYTGSSIGSVLGSAIGGITGGRHGHDVGTIIGMAGGAIVGGAIGAKADQDRQEGYERARERVEQRRMERDRYDSNAGYNNRNNSYDGGAYSNEEAYDDRLYDFDTSSSYEAVTESSADAVRLGRVRFVNRDNDAVLRSNEVSKLVFEVRNVSSHTLYNVQPVVEETSGNKRIWVSPSAFIENLEPGRAVRYTAMVSTGKLKNGNASFHVYVQHNGRVVADSNEFTLTTQK